MIYFTQIGCKLCFISPIHSMPAAVDSSFSGRICNCINSSMIGPVKESEIVRIRLLSVWFHPRKVKVKVAQSCRTLRLCGLYGPWNSPGQNTGVGSLSLLQGIFPTQELNLCLPHCRHILYQLSHMGSLYCSRYSYLLNLQGIFLTQESNQGLLHCRQILYQLSYQGSSHLRKENTLPSDNW